MCTCVPDMNILLEMAGLVPVRRPLPLPAPVAVGIMAGVDRQIEAVEADLVVPLVEET